MSTSSSAIALVLVLPSACAGCQLGREGTGSGSIEADSATTVTDTVEVDFSDSVESAEADVDAATDISTEEAESDVALREPSTILGMTVWLNASGIETDGSGRVQRWRDLSTFGNDFAQAEVTHRPTLLSVGAVQFSSSWLDGPSLGVLTGTAGMTLFLVIRPATPVSSSALCYQTDGVFTDRGAYVGVGLRAGDGYCAFAYATAYQDTGVLPAKLGTLQIVALRVGVGLLELTVDGATVTRVIAPVSSLAAKTLLGRGYLESLPGAFAVHELVGYSRPLLASEIVDVTSYLRAKHKL